jgi:hypothetical protein
MNSKTSIVFGAVAIAAIALFFASAPITGNQQALALVVVHGHAGYYHGHYFYHGYYPYYHHFYYGHYYGPYYHHFYYGHYRHYGPYY